MITLHLIKGANINLALLALLLIALPLVSHVKERLSATLELILNMYSYFAYTAWSLFASEWEMTSECNVEQYGLFSPVVQIAVAVLAVVRQRLHAV